LEKLEVIPQIIRYQNQDGPLETSPIIQVGSIPPDERSLNDRSY